MIVGRPPSWKQAIALLGERSWKAQLLEVDPAAPQLRQPLQQIDTLVRAKGLRRHIDDVCDRVSSPVRNPRCPSPTLCGLCCQSHSPSPFAL
jgi:hypothetical protein